ncbi:MAG: bifunctional homocysteine S-methyltransferase/methylenetetrahydrofolate reductase [Thermomicrobiales bacterium]
MSHPFLDRLRQGPLLLDGAMGTMLYAGGAALDECFDALTLTHPEQVASIHRAYIRAGADIIETNTFGANRAKLEVFGLGGQVRDINRRAAKLAREEREISGAPVLVAGAVGPTGRTIAPIGMTAPETVREIFEEQISALLEGGVDLLVLETMGSVAESRQAILAAQAVGGLPIVVLLTFAEDGRTIGGETPEHVVAALLPLGPAAIGANCSVGPSRTLAVLRRLSAALDVANLPDPPALVVMPNAGWPTHVGGRVIYQASPDYFAGFGQEAIEAGASIVGGCCGTTPAHVAALRGAFDAGVARPERHGLGVTVPRGEESDAPANPLAMGTEPTDEPTDVAKALGKTFLVSVEIDPPKGFNPAKALAGAQLLKDAGVHAINVADSPMARVRMSAMTLSYVIQHRVGIETIVHFTTRDRSLMGLQSELLGAHAVGVRNILALTGDPPSLGDYPDSSAVYDVDSVGLIRVLRRLNEGVDSAGASIGRGASFTIACAVDPTKADLADEARRLRAKLDAGAHFVMTQPIFDLSVWHRFLEIYAAEWGTADLGLPVMLGILPLQSTKHAEFLHNEVPGITLTDEARARMRGAGSDGRQAGVTMAQDLLAAAVPHVQGVYLMPSFGRYEVAAEVLKAIPVAAPV